MYNKLVENYLEENLKIEEVLELISIKEIGTDVVVSCECLSDNGNVVYKEETISLFKLMSFMYEKMPEKENNYEDHH